MKKILVPIDFSATSEKAFRYAAEIASRAGGELILFHAWTPVSTLMEATVSERKAQNSVTEADVRIKLERLKRKVLGTGNKLPVTTAAAKAPVIKALQQFIKLNQPDLVVMGTQGATGLKKILIGSTTARLIERASVPLLLVPEKFTYAVPRRMLLTTDYLDAGKDSLQVMLELALLFKASVRVVHMLDMYQSDYEKKKAQMEFDRYAYYLQKNSNTVKLRFDLLPVASVKETMGHLQQKIPYDILAMTRRKKNRVEKWFLQSLTVNMAFVTKYPLLMIPEK